MLIKMKKNKKIDVSKLKIDESKFIDYGKVLDKKHGKRGTKSREEFTDRAYAYYYGEILKQRRKELKLSQTELAEKIGKARPYISQVENGRDMKLSNLLTIATALGLTLELRVA